MRGTWHTCERCKRFRGYLPRAGEEPNEPPTLPTCDSFPLGIPLAIFSGRYGQDAPYPGDCEGRFRE